MRAENTEKRKQRLFEQIDAVSCGRYAMAVWEVRAISERRNGLPVDCMCDAYNYGFLKGQRAEQHKEKAARTSAKVQTAGRDNVTLNQENLITPVEEYQVSIVEVERIREIARRCENQLEAFVSVYVEGRRSALAMENLEQECCLLAIVSKLRRADERVAGLAFSFVKGLTD